MVLIHYLLLDGHDSYEWSYTVSETSFFLTLVVSLGTYMKRRLIKLFLSLG